MTSSNEDLRMTSSSEDLLHVMSSSGDVRRVTSSGRSSSENNRRPDKTISSQPVRRKDLCKLLGLNNDTDLKSLPEAKIAQKVALMHTSKTSSTSAYPKATLSRSTLRRRGSRGRPTIKPTRQPPATASAKRSGRRWCKRESTTKRGIRSSADRSSSRGSKSST